MYTVGRANVHVCVRLSACARAQINVVNCSLFALPVDITPLTTIRAVPHDHGVIPPGNSVAKSGDRVFFAGPHGTRFAKDGVELRLVEVEVSTGGTRHVVNAKNVDEVIVARNYSRHKQTRAYAHVSEAL